MKRVIPFLVFALIFSVLISCRKAGTPKYPNLIVIMTDDQGYADVGFNGCKDIPTPNIDKIAAQGVRFTDGYVSFPVCSPSRAGFITGRYQDRFGYTTNPSIDPENPIAGLPVEEETMAQILRKANYKSAIIGKWHLGTHPKFHPLERGFDYFYGFLSGGHDYYPESLTLNDLSEVKRKWQWYGTKIIENRATVETDEYLTDELSNAAVQFIKKQAEANQRFMVYLAYNAPHTPLQATEKYLSRFSDIKDEKRKTYAAMVSAVDDGVDLVPYLTGEKKGEPHEYLFWRKWEQNAMAIRHGITKVVADRNQKENPPELYDLHSNVSEAQELKSTSGTTYDQLLSKWQEWDKQMKDREFPTLGADKWWK